MFTVMHYYNFPTFAQQIQSLTDWRSKESLRDKGNALRLKACIEGQPLHFMRFVCMNILWSQSQQYPAFLTVPSPLSLGCHTCKNSFLTNKTLLYHLSVTCTHSQVIIIRISEELFVTITMAIVLLCATCTHVSFRCAYLIAKHTQSAPRDRHEIESPVCTSILVYCGRCCVVVLHFFFSFDFLLCSPTSLSNPPSPRAHNRFNWDCVH